MNITYEYWKSRIENGDFILVDDDKYDDFTKIYEKETEICFKKEDVVEKELHVFDPSEEEQVVEEVVEEEDDEDDDILEDKRSKYITFIVWFLALCAVAGITLNATFHDSSEQVDTKIIEKYDAIDIAWLIL